eukprot:SAG31_NODE_321_length_17733_cov_41.320177_6_plen_66_part_00
MVNGSTVKPNTRRVSYCIPSGSTHGLELVSKLQRLACGLLIVGGCVSDRLRQWQPRCAEYGALSG